MPRDLAAIFASIDILNTDQFMSYFTPTAIFRFGNAAPIRGRDDIKTAALTFFTTIQALSHQIVRSHEIGATAIVETLVTYTRKEGRVVTVLNCDVAVFEGVLIKEWLIYIDLGPVCADQ